MTALASPQRMQLVEDMRRHLEGAPNPARQVAFLLHLDRPDTSAVIEHHGVEQLRPLDRVSGSPTSTGSSPMRGAARKIASHSPMGEGCIT